MGGTIVQSMCHLQCLASSDSLIAFLLFFVPLRICVNLRNLRTASSYFFVVPLCRRGCFCTAVHSLRCTLHSHLCASVVLFCVLPPGTLEFTLVEVIYPRCGDAFGGAGGG